MRSHGVLRTGRPSQKEGRRLELRPGATQAMSRNDSTRGTGKEGSGSDSERTNSEPVDVPTALDEPETADDSKAVGVSRIPGVLDLDISDPPLHVHADYPDGDLNEGEVRVCNYGIDDTVHVTAMSKAADGERRVEFGVTLSPGDAEQLAARLEERAVEARSVTKHPESEKRTK